MVQGNYLLRHLTSVFNAINDNLKIDMQIIDTLDSNQLTDDWTFLFKNMPQVAMDLVKLTLAQTGVSKSLISFSDLIPADVYRTLVEKALDNVSSEETFHNYTLEFFQHFYMNNSLVPVEVLEEDAEFGGLKPKEIPSVFPFIKKLMRNPLWTSEHVKGKSTQKTYNEETMNKKLQMKGITKNSRVDAILKVNPSYGKGFLTHLFPGNVVSGLVNKRGTINPIESQYAMEWQSVESIYPTNNVTKLAATAAAVKQAEATIPAITMDKANEETKHCKSS